MKTIKGKISFLVLLLGVVLIVANLLQNEKLLKERSIARIESEASRTGARLAGMMQYFLRRGQPRAAELEMSYASVSSELVWGVVWASINCSWCFLFFPPMRCMTRALWFWFMIRATRWLWHETKLFMSRLCRAVCWPQFV